MRLQHQLSCQNLMALSFFWKRQVATAYNRSVDRERLKRGYLSIYRAIRCRIRMGDGTFG